MNGWRPTVLIKQYLDEQKHRDESPTSPAEAQMAHELNNLLDGSLRNVTLAMNLMRDLNDAADAESDQATERLRTAAEAMTRMSALLHRWMRAGCGPDAARLYWQDATLSDAIQYALRLIEPAADQKHVRLTQIVCPQVAAIPAGPLYPVLINAIRNAVEAAPQHGHVEVHAERRDDHLLLHVSDDGPGLPDDLPRDDDGLVHFGATTKPTGHGMGLAVCRQIIETLGGRITLDDGDGGGAVLAVRLPLPDTEYLPPNAKSNTDAPTPTHEVSA